MAVALIAWSTTYPLPGHVLKSQIQSVSQTLSRLSLKATIFCADAISDGEAKSGLELPSIRPPQLAASFAFQTIVAMLLVAHSGLRGDGTLRTRLGKSGQRSILVRASDDANDL